MQPSFSGSFVICAYLPAGSGQRASQKHNFDLTVPLQSVCRTTVAPSKQAMTRGSGSETLIFQAENNSMTGINGFSSAVKE